jgi:hypothetical protein
MKTVYWQPTRPIRTEGLIDRQTDITKPIVTLHNFANVPKNGPFIQFQTICRRPRLCKSIRYCNLYSGKSLVPRPTPERITPCRLCHMKTVNFARGDIKKASETLS